jgi:hypothetical protein
LNNVRQLNLALQLHVDENEGSFPTHSPSLHWPAQLQSQYKNPALLSCPTDRDPASASGPGLSAADTAARSYLMNGFQDPGVSDYVDENWNGFLTGTRRGSIRENEIVDPAETILLGEKKSGTTYFTADLHQERGSFYDKMETARHAGSDPSSAPLPSSALLRKKSGISIYGFADGSVRPIGWGKSTCPINRWGVSGYWRTNYAICF